MRFFLSRGSISHAAGARRGSIHSCEGHRPLLALLPSGHGERAVALVAGKAPAAEAAAVGSRFRRAFAEGEQLVSLPSATDV